MSDRLSNSAIDALGDRLAAAGMDGPDPQDLALLEQILHDRDLARQEVQLAVQTATGLEPTGRVKSTATLIAKVDRGTKLSRIQDLAGVRIIVSGGRVRQDAIVAQLVKVYPDARVVDRRADPSHGYRAVHLIIKHPRSLVEVQVRTPAQHQWAEIVERLADSWGRQLRYGFPANEPNRVIEPGITRADIITRLMRVSELVDRVEAQEVRTAALIAPKDLLLPVRLVGYLYIRWSGRGIGRAIAGLLDDVEEAAKHATAV